jgi:hypothetical protein
MVTAISIGLSKCTRATIVWPERQKPTIPGQYSGMAAANAEAPRKYANAVCRKSDGGKPDYTPTGRESASMGEEA